jgi:hypothetical protein
MAGSDGRKGNGTGKYIIELSGYFRTRFTEKGVLKQRRPQRGYGNDGSKHNYE